MAEVYRTNCQLFSPSRVCKAAYALLGEKVPTTDGNSKRRPLHPAYRGGSRLEARIQSFEYDSAAIPIPVIDLGVDDAEERTDVQFGEKMFFIRGGQYELLEVPLEDGNSRWTYHTPVPGHAYINALSSIIHWQLGGKNINVTVRKFLSILYPNLDESSNSQKLLLGVLSSWLNCSDKKLYLGKLTITKKSTLLSKK